MCRRIAVHNTYKFALLCFKTGTIGTGKKRAAGTVAVTAYGYKATLGKLGLFRLPGTLYLFFAYRS